MILNNTLKYSLSKVLLIPALLLVSMLGYAQEEDNNSTDLKIVKPEETVVLDTIPYKYGIRLGVDISGPIKTLFNKNYISYEGNIDARVYKEWFVAGDFGYVKNHVYSTTFDYTSEGNFSAIGFDKNTLGYKEGRNDMFALGVRYGYSKFTQTVNNFIIENGYWLNQPYKGTLDEQDASAHWLNVRLTMKVETLKNLYIGGSAGVNFLITDYAPEGFKNLYIPGFGFRKDGIAFAFNYSIMYLLPFN
ncbi:MAG: hypothetical protein KAG96_05600 [Ichthyobacteriaceae bacterium]|nr:hypothetical protein [Ichthyobacteriaceae bacterium]